MRDGKRKVLKLMEDAEHLKREVSIHVCNELENEYIVNICRVHIDGNNSDAAIANDLGNGRWRKKPDVCIVEPGWPVEHNQYGFCLVLEQADCSMHDASTTEHFVRWRWTKVRSIGEDILDALRHLHSKSLIHGNLSPSHIIQAEGKWKLMMDPDMACVVDESFGSKVPVGGHFPPEVAKLMLSAGFPGNGDASRLSEYKADVAYDLWSFGTLLFWLATKKKLFELDDGSCDGDDLRKLANWDNTKLAKRLAEGSLEEEQEALCNLIKKLLEADPEVSLQHLCLCCWTCFSGGPAWVENDWAEIFHVRFLQVLLFFWLLAARAACTNFERGAIISYTGCLVGKIMCCWLYRLHLPYIRFDLSHACVVDLLSEAEGILAWHASGERCAEGPIL